MSPPPVIKITEVILISRKPSNSILPSLLLFCESMVKIKTFEDMLFFFFFFSKQADSMDG